MDGIRIRKILWIALLVSLGARLYVNFFIPGFIITFTAIILGISLYFNEDVHPVILGLTVAVMSPAIRLFVESFSGQSFKVLFAKVYPDVYFYITYGIVFYALTIMFAQQRAEKYFIILFLSDFLSNFVELMVRTNILNLESSMVEGIMMIAIGRTILTMLSIYAVVRYTTLLMKQEHDKRYRYLMMLSSRFRSEIYILHKNMTQIEELVGLSHRIKRMSSQDDTLKDLTLDLSKGVHEIKKDYIRAVQGLEDIYDGEVNFNELEMKDLFSILDDNTKEILRKEKSDVKCSFKCKANVMVKEHFYMMSVLRNLINNSVEACDTKGKVSIMATEVEDEIKIKVQDNGKGISEEDHEYIFNMGYSTKFNKETGDIYRGVGLALVKELIENVFKGTIVYESVIGAGTCFTIAIKRSVLERGE